MHSSSLVRCTASLKDQFGANSNTFWALSWVERNRSGWGAAQAWIQMSYVGFKPIIWVEQAPLKSWATNFQMKYSVFLCQDDRRVSSSGHKLRCKAATDSQGSWNASAPIKSDSQLLYQQKSDDKFSRILYYPLILARVVAISYKNMVIYKPLPPIQRGPSSGVSSVSSDKSANSITAADPLVGIWYGESQ